MAGYNLHREEVAIKRRKLNCGQAENVFFNEENSQQSLTRRITSFFSRTVTPLRSLWRIMRNSGTSPDSVSLSEAAVESYLKAKVKPKEQKNSTDICEAADGSSEDEEIKVLEAEIAKEDYKDINAFDAKPQTVALPEVDDDVQVITVIEHSTNKDHEDFIPGSDNITSFKRSICSLRKRGSNIVSDEGNCSITFRNDHDFEEYCDGLPNFSGSGSIISEADAFGLSEINSTHTDHTSISSFSSPPCNVSNTGIITLPAPPSSANMPAKVGRLKLNEFTRLERVRPQMFWKHVNKQKVKNDRIMSKLQKGYFDGLSSTTSSKDVINIDAKERYRCFLKDLSLDCNLINSPTSFKRQHIVKLGDCSPSKVLLRGRNILNQLFSENFASDSNSPLHSENSVDDLKAEVCKDEKPERFVNELEFKNLIGEGTTEKDIGNKMSYYISRQGVSVERDNFEARLETEKSNSAITRNRLLRHTQESELRQKRAEILTLEKRLRETARLDEEISLEEEIRKKLTISGYIFRDRKPKVEKVEFPDLDENALATIDMVWYGGKVLDEKFGERITRRDLLTLRGLDWLNDEVIDTYLGLVCERAKKNSSLPKVYAFTTFFYTNLSQHGYSKVKRWTRKVDIFSYDILLIPVHLGAHWCLAVVDFQRMCIEYYDSMGGENNRCLNALRLYLNEESMDKRKKPFETKSWKCYCRQDIPQQMNGSDCGMFACKFAEFASRRAQIIFSQENMPYYRQRMVYEICRGSLL